MKRKLLFLLAITVIFTFTACTNNKEVDKTSKNDTVSDKKENELQSLTMENFNKNIVFDKTPEKILSLDLTNTETLIALGLEDRIAGIRLGNFQINELLDQNQEKAKKLNFPDEIKKGIPTLENIIKLSPDLLIMNGYYFNVPHFGKYEDYEKNGIKIYVSEGSYGDTIGIENVYRDIKNLSKIFNVEKKGNELLHSFKSRVDVVKERVKNKKSVSVLAIDSVGDEITVAGGKGLENDLINIAGGKNIFEDIDKQFSKVGLENIIKRNPDYIIVHSYSNDNNAKDKIEYLKSKKELSSINAIKNNKILVIKLMGVFPGVQNFDTLEKMSDFFMND